MPLTQDSSAAIDQLRCRLAAAQAGSAEAVAWLVDVCRPYLLEIANAEWDADLRPKMGASDLVQESSVEAQRDFHGFRGDSVEKLRGWLRGVLRNTMADERKRLRTGRRDVAKERVLDESGPSGLASALLVADTPTPSECAVNREQLQMLEACQARLPEHYQRVLALRYQAIPPHLQRARHAIESRATRHGFADPVDKQHKRARDDLRRTLDGRLLKQYRPFCFSRGSDERAALQWPDPLR